MTRNAIRSRVVCSVLLVLTVVLIREMAAQAPVPADESQVKQGLAIAPVPLDLRGKNRALVALGSY